jgi:hypothetical protein
MEVASRWSFPVGVVRWHAPAPTLTVVLKATFCLSGPRAGALHDIQQPLFVDAPGTCGTEEELENASDLAPRKARADVLLVGHAHSALPCREIEAGIGIDGWHKRFRVGSAVATRAIPLLSQHLARESDAGPVRVAPRPASVPGWISRALGTEFDFGRFNVAPRDQQLDALSSRSRIALAGLLSGAPRCEVALPGLEPVAFVVPSRERVDFVKQLSMTCDTLWIHTDHALCTLAWRGTVPMPSNDAYLVVDAAYGEVLHWPAVAAQLGNVHWFNAGGDAPTATSCDDDEATLATPARGDDLSTTAKTRIGPATLRQPSTEETVGLPVETEDEPDRAMLTVRRRPLADVFSAPSTDETLALPEGQEPPTHRGPVFPFQPPASTNAVAALERMGPSTIGPNTIGPVAVEGAMSPLPFAGVRPPPPPLAGVMQRRIHGEETMAPHLATDVAPGHESVAALPFQSSPRTQLSPSDRPAPLPPSRQTAVPVLPPAPPLPAVPYSAASASAQNDDATADDVTKKRAPVRHEAIALETYAAIKVALLRGKPLEAVLAQHGIEEISWRIEERRRADGLSRAAERGDLNVVQALRRAMRDAQRQAEEAERGNDR